MGLDLRVLGFIRVVREARGIGELLDGCAKVVRHVDVEMRWFYVICAGIPAALGVLFFSLDGWIPSVGLVAIAVGFMFAGWPVSITVVTPQRVVLRAPLRRIVVDSDNLRSLKAKAKDDWRAQIVLRTHRGLPIGYRQDRFSDAAGLAAVMLSIAQASRPGVVHPDAERLLVRTANK